MSPHKFTHIWRAIFLCLIFGTIAHANETESVASFVAQGPGVHSIEKNMEFFEDLTGQLTIDDVVAGKSPPFQHAQSFKPSYSNSVYWVRFSIDFRQYQESYSYLSKTFAHIGKFELFSLKNGKYIAHSLDENKSSYDRTINVLDYIFKLETPSEGRETYYVRMEPRHHAVSLNFNWSSPSSLIETTSSSQLMYGIIFGGFFVLLVYNLFIFAVTHDKSYLFYIYYLSTLALVMSDLDGFASIFLDISPDQSKIFVYLLYGSMHGGTLFYRKFFNLNEYLPKFDAFLKFVPWTMFVGALVTLAVPVGTAYSICVLFIPVMAVALTSIGLIRWKQGFEPAIFTSIGMLILGVCATIFILQLRGYIPSTKITASATQIGALCESLMLAFALGFRIKLADNDNKVLIEKLKLSLISEQKALSIAQAATAGKNAFLGMISHELRTPLQAIISSLDLLSIKKFEPKIAEVVNRLGSSANQLDLQMRELTDYARLDSGQASMEHTECNIEICVSAVVENFRIFAESRGLNLHFYPPENEITVFTDAVRFQQIANNLVSNAIKYTEKGDVFVKLKYETRNSQLFAILSVEDTGIGIGDKDVSDIFTPFLQLENTNRNRNEGVGIGLAIVKQLVSLFGGDLKVTSKIGQGSIFTCAIPVEQVTTANEILSFSEQELNDYSLLLVDDTPRVLHSLKDLIEQIYSSCDTAENGMDAINKLDAKLYDAILLDINMPGMDGYKVAQAIRNGDGLNKLTPIIWISANAPEMLQREREILLTHFYQKPIRIQKLHLFLEKILAEKVSPSEKLHRSQVLNTV